jgi:aspartate carbamoyltransferase catalytic subunit
MTWPRHLLDVADMPAALLTTVMEVAAEMRRHVDRRSIPLAELRGRRVALLFAEPSTRTRLSFEIAARNLGAETFVLDAPASSLAKGESVADTARTLAALGADMLVLRHHRSGAPWVAARYFAGHVVNAGDGWHAHPTQALLDLFTLRRAFGEDALAGRKVAIVGDLRHSRVARSNVWTLTASGVDLWLCGPPALLAERDKLSVSNGGRLTLTDDLPAALHNADAVMALRLQRERMTSRQVVFEDYIERYQINAWRMAQARPGAFFLHPGPLNQGVEVSAEVASGPASLVAEQVRNGVPVRMAVLALLGRSAASTG